MTEVAARTRGTAWRLFATVWLVYAAHFSSNVVRETYLAVSLGEHGTLRVDDYLGLHPDLIEVPGRGAFIDNNPGASFLGAVPYAAARPFLGILFRWKPQLVAPKPPATYDDPRPNRTRFMNEARARGVDVKLGLAALVMQVGLMAPLGAAAAVLMYLVLLARLGDDRRALWLAVLFAFGTPMFFRAAYLNQNLVVAVLAFAAFVLMVGLRPRSADEPLPTGRLVAVGALLGYAVVCDYSGAPLLLVFGFWALHRARRLEGAAGVWRTVRAFALGGVGPLALLLAYQYAAFGSPWWPAQRYMPATPYSVRGWLGFTAPTAELMAGNLFDPRYGLLAFCPLLVLAFAAPLVRPREPGPSGHDGWPARGELAAIFASCGALYLFSSANQYANLQWNTGVRYMVPAVPLLFVAAVPVLLRLPRAARAVIIGVTMLVSWSVAMTREGVVDALRIVLTRGPVLPVTTALEKMRSGYSSLYAGPAAPLAILALLAMVLLLIWRGYGRLGPHSEAPVR